MPDTEPGAWQELKGECLKKEGSVPEALSGSGALSAHFYSSAFHAVIVPSGETVIWPSHLCTVFDDGGEDDKVRDA